MLDERQKFDIFQKITVANTVTQSTLDDMAIKAMVELLDNQGYEFNDIKAALNKCCIEVKGRLSLKDIIDRLPKKGDELPTADEAWGLVYDFDNDQKTIIAPAIAFEAGRCGAFNLISTDKVAARMAFKAAYDKLIPNYSGKPIRYEISLSDDKEERRTALIQAVEDGKITKQHALKYEFDLEFKDEPPLLPNSINKEEWRTALLEAVGEKIGENEEVLTKQHALKLIADLEELNFINNLIEKNKEEA